MPFIDRYNSYPSDAVLTAIEGIKIIDLTPPGNIQGVGSNVVAVVGEFLRCGKRSNCYSPASDSNINIPTEIFGSQDLLDTFGGWSAWSNPGGARPAPGNPGTLPLDGNGFLAIRNRKFARLVCVNVAQDVGTATITLTTDLISAGVYQLPFAGKIPAGIRISDGGTEIFATTEDIEFTAVTGSSLTAGVSWVGSGNVGAAEFVMTMTGVPVRRLSGTVTTSFTTSGIVLAPEATTCLSGYTLDCTAFATSSGGEITEDEMSTAYITALNALLNDSKPANEVSVVYSARHTGDGKIVTAAGGLRDNAVTASAKGRGRIALVAPPLGTAHADAIKSSAPGVGNYGLSDRVIYCYPGSNAFYPEIPSAYISSSSSGMLDWPAEPEMASILSQLPPERNPGEQTEYINHVQATETGVTGLTRAKYEAYRASGIAALRIDPVTGVQFQSGVTSVNPATYPKLRNIYRRRMADYIQDSLAAALVAFNKSLNTPSKRNAIRGEIEAFMMDLLSANNPEMQRIAAYHVDEESGNTPTRLAQGIVVFLVEVQLLSTMDFITLVCNLGETVDVQVA